MSAHKYPIGAVVSYKFANRYQQVHEGRGVVIERHETHTGRLTYLLKAGYKGRIVCVGEDEITAVFDNALALVLEGD